MKPNPRFLASGVGATASAQWDKLGIKTHAAFAVLSNEDAEIARNCPIAPLFREMKWPKAKVSFTRKGDEAVFTSDNFAWRVCLDLDGEHSLADNLAASKRVSHFAHEVFPHASPVKNMHSSREYSSSKAVPPCERFSVNLSSYNTLFGVFK